MGWIGLAGEPGAGARPECSRGSRLALLDYADGQDASPFGRMLGELIHANLRRADRRRDFDGLRTRVGIEVTDIGEAVTLDFQAGRLVISNGLRPQRAITIRTDSDTVLQLSNLRIGPLGLPVYVDATGRDVVRKLLSGRLKIEGMLANVGALSAVTRIFSVR